MKNKKDELRDYLFKTVQTLDLEKKEMEEIEAYTKDMIEKFANVFKLTSSDHSKDLVAKAFSKLIEEENVKRDA